MKPNTMRNFKGTISIFVFLISLICTASFGALKVSASMPEGSTGILYKGSSYFTCSFTTDCPMPFRGTYKIYEKSMTADQGYSSQCYSLDFSKAPTGTYTSSATYGSLSDTQKKWIKYTLMFGKTVKNIQYNSTYYYVATQLLIWNIAYGSFTATAEQSDAETYMLASTHDGNIKDIYSVIRADLLSYDSKVSAASVPSFASLNTSDAITQLLYYNPADHLFETTLTDSNNALSDYPFASAGGIAADNSVKNHLSLSTGSAISSPQTLSTAYTGASGILNTAVEGAPVYWVNGDAQPFVSLDTAAPKSAYVKIQTAPAHTTVILTSDSVKSSYGNPVKFTATLDHKFGRGTITFQDETTGGTLCTANLDGKLSDETTVSFDCSALSAGNHSITAIYSGVENYYEGKTSDPLSHEIVAQTVSPTLDASSSTSTVGDSVSFTLHGLPTDAGGTVTFYDGEVQLGEAIVATPGIAPALSTAALGKGDHTITAKYSGDAKYASAETVTIYTVAANTVILSVIPSSPTSRVGDSMSFTLHGLPIDAGGTVTFYDGEVQLSEAIVVTPGIAPVLSTAALGKGDHTITAKYSGDAKYASAETATIYTVAANMVVLSVISVSPTSTVGDSVSFTLHGLPIDAGGTVTFYDGEVPLGEAIVVTPGHDVSITTSVLTVGEHEISVAYKGAAKYAGAKAKLLHMVNKMPVSMTLTADNAQSYLNESLTLAVSSLPKSAAGETVTFQDGDTVIGKGIIDGSGTAFFITTTLSGGNHQFIACYPGDDYYEDGHSDSLSVNIYIRLPEQPVIPTADAGSIVTNGESSADHNQIVTIAESVSVPLASNPKTDGRDISVLLYAALVSLSILVGSMIKRRSDRS